MTNCIAQMYSPLGTKLSRARIKIIYIDSRTKSCAINNYNIFSVMLKRSILSYL